MCMCLSVCLSVTDLTQIHGQRVIPRVLGYVGMDFKGRVTLKNFIFRFMLSSGVEACEYFYPW